MLEADLPATISTHIFRILRRKIIEGELQPGKALREEEIREQHGSSRGPIRESLRLLLQTGLVEHQPRRGFKVRDYTPEEIRHIYALRAELEAQVIAGLEGRNLAPLVTALRKICAKMTALFEANDLQGYFKENARFHGEIIQFADNRILSEVLEYVNEVSLPVRYRVMGDALPSRRSLSYHERIVDLLATDKIGAAIAETRQHILENVDRAVATYAEVAPSEL